MNSSTITSSRKHSRIFFNILRQTTSVSSNNLPSQQIKKKTIKFFFEIHQFHSVNFNHSTLLSSTGMEKSARNSSWTGSGASRACAHPSPPSSAAGKINFVPWRDNSRPRVDALTRVKISPRSTPLAETRAFRRRDAPFVVVPEKKKIKKKTHSSICLDTFARSFGQFF